MRTVPTRTRAGILTGCLALVLTGCSEQKREYAIPEKFCGVPAPKETTSPLFPPGKDIEQWGDDLLTDSRTSCKTSVDRRVVLFILVHKVDKPYDPMAEMEAYKFTNRKSMGDLPFEGTGAVGDKNAMITARCDAPEAPYVIVDVRVDESVNDDVVQRRKDTTRFIKEFTVEVKKALNCTR